MACMQPIRIGNKKVSCRKCIPCGVSRSFIWKLRLFHEFIATEQKGVFITLTYNNDNYPSDGNVEKKVIQLFIKRVRQNLEKKKKKKKKKPKTCLLKKLKAAEERKKEENEGCVGLEISQSRHHDWL